MWEKTDVKERSSISFRNLVAYSDWDSWNHPGGLDSQLPWGFVLGIKIISKIIVFLYYISESNIAKSKFPWFTDYYGLIDVCSVGLLYQRM